MAQTQDIILLSRKTDRFVVMVRRVPVEAIYEPIRGKVQYPKKYQDVKREFPFTPEGRFDAFMYTGDLARRLGLWINYGGFKEPVSQASKKIYDNLYNGVI